MIQHLAVVVPAADEQDGIAACLRSINEAREKVLESESAVESVDVIVVLDACTDETPLIVSYFSAPHVQVIASEAGRVGAARKRGALRALATSFAPERVWLANTDADSTVPADWLSGMVAAANSGFDVVLGTVLPGPELSASLRVAWSAPHRLTEDHPHIHGANLGIRADTYLELGGWDAALSHNEDVALASRAVAAPHIRILRTAGIPVITSARVVGRTPHGFSSYMRHLRDDNLVAR